MKLNRNYTEIKKAIYKVENPSLFTGKYRFSPYMACSHACKYCDGRYEKYNVLGDFETDIVIRKNLIQCLQKELPKLREKGPIGIQSGISDSYQPVEKSEELTRKALLEICQYNHPVTIHTKSTLIKRDIDIVKQISDNTSFNVMISFTMLDDNLRKIFEPNASTIQERIELIKLLKRNNINVGILAMPFIPYLTDSDDMINQLFDKFEELEVDFVWPYLMTLKKGRQKEMFLKTISENFPELLKDFNDLYHENHWSGEPIFKYVQRKMDFIHMNLIERKIPLRPPHSNYKGIFQKYDEIIMLLYDMIFLFSQKKVKTQRLSASIKPLKEWIKEEKKYFSRRYKTSYNDLDIILESKFKDSSIKKILNNDKLFSFLYEIVINDAVFDYTTLKLS